MPTEFFASARYKMKIPETVQGIRGGLILPSGIALHTLERRNLTRSHPHLARRLLDPQLYLAGLNVSACRKACTYLSSYGWFGDMASFPPFDSSKQTQPEWAAQARTAVTSSWLGRVPTTSTEIEDAIRLCLETQNRIGCEALILPSPLTTNPASDYSAELQWLDSGLTIASGIDQSIPRCATISVSDTCLRGIPPAENALLDVIVDQVTARSPEAAYVVLEQANEDGYYCAHPNTIGALLRLVDGLKVGGTQRVVVAFAGTAGLLALAAGADTWSTGWYRGERRLRLVDFEQQEGRAVPTYYSHGLAGEFHLAADLDRVNKAGFLPSIADATEASEGLLKALAAGRPVSAVPEWQHRLTNVAASIEHFLAVMARETEILSSLSPTERIDYVQRWLDRADQLASELYSVGSFNVRTALNHQRSWRDAFARFLKER
jgi:hypothetical protein